MTTTVVATIVDTRTVTTTCGIPAIPSFPTVISNGSTYYVDKDIGDDGHTKAEAQNPATPWATIAHGISQLVAGDILDVVEAATSYDECLDISLMGDATHWFTIQGVSGTPTIRSTVGGNYPVDIAQSSSAYIYFKNFDILSTVTAYAGVFVRGSNDHIYIDTLDISACSNGIVLGAGSNDLTDPPAMKAGVSYFWMDNCLMHNNAAEGFIAYRRSNNIVIDNSSAYSNGNDGFASPHALGGNTWEDHGPPDDKLDCVSNIYITNTSAYSNTGEGFDFGALTGDLVYKNCSAYGNANGLKVWNERCWIINSKVYRNTYDGIGIKPLWDDSHIYVYYSTLVLNADGEWGGQIHGIEINSTYTLKTGYLHLIDCILYAGTNNYGNELFFDHTNVSIAEEQNNYYFSQTDETAFQFRTHGTTPITNYTFSDIADGTWAASSGLGDNDISKTHEVDGLDDPGFTDTANDDYTLLATSLAVGAALAIEVTDDFAGVARGSPPDMGAYEYV